jgi:hypothetical protein
MTGELRPSKTRDLDRVYLILDLFCLISTYNTCTYYTEMTSTAPSLLG